MRRRPSYKVQTRNTGEPWTTRVSSFTLGAAEEVAARLAAETSGYSFRGEVPRRYFYVRIVHRGLVLFQWSGDLVHRPGALASETSREGVA